MKAKFTLRKLARYFLQGLIILAPIAITVLAVTSLFDFIDNILPGLIDRIAPDLLKNDETGKPVRVPGLGFIVVILIVILVGYISSSFVVGRMVELFDKVLERTPGVKLIYSTVKDFVEAFAGDKRKFDRPILVNIHSSEVWQIGFITQDEASKFGLTEFVSVYLPQSYAFAGHLYFVKRDRIRLLTGISASEAMKFAISGGVTEIGEELKHASANTSNPQ